MARPLFLDNDLLKRADDLQFEQMVSNSISSLQFPHRIEESIRGLRALAFGDPDATEWTPTQSERPEPLPIVVSPQPQVQPITTPEQMQRMWQLGNGGVNVQTPQDTSGVEPGGTSTAQGSAVSSAPAASPNAAGAPTPMPTAGSTDLESYTRQKAASLGIDPDTAIRVGNTEGGFNDPVRQNARGAPAYGPFQMYIGGPQNPGLGDELLARGIDPRKPENVYRAIDFALEHAAKNGWGAFQGAAAAGIGPFQGIGSATAPTPPVPGVAQPQPATSARPAPNLSTQVLETPNTGGVRKQTIGMVIHSTRGQGATPDAELQGTLGWFRNPSSQVSANAVIGQDGSVYMTNPDAVAWHAGENNGNYFGVELVQSAKDAADGKPFTDAQYASLAALTQQMSQRYGFPIDRQHIVGHEELEQGRRGGKTDPGPTFNWNRYIQQAGGNLPLAAAVAPTAAQPAAGLPSSASAGPAQPAEAPDVMYRQPLGMATSGPDTVPTADVSSAQSGTSAASPPVTVSSPSAPGAFQDDYTNAGWTPRPTDASSTVSDASGASGPGAVAPPAPQVIPNEDATSYGPAPQPNGGFGIVDTSGPEQGPQLPVPAAQVLPNEEPPPNWNLGRGLDTPPGIATGVPGAPDLSGYQKPQQPDDNEAMVDAILRKIATYGEAGRHAASLAWGAIHSGTFDPHEAFSILGMLPYDLYTRARQELISDKEALRAEGTDPLIGARALGVPGLPSAEAVNPEGRPAGDVLFGTVAGAVAPGQEFVDPLFAGGLHAAGYGLGLAGRGAAAGARALRSGAEAAGRGAAAVGREIQAGAERARALEAERAAAGQVGAPAYGVFGFVPPEAEGVVRPRVRPDAGDIEARAVQEFGTTESPRETGYILRDGTGLDFSGKKYGGPGYSREMDHREIGRATGQGGTEGMQQFMSDTGAVRFSNYGNDLVVHIPGGLSDAQRARLLEEGRYAEVAAVDVQDPKTFELLQSQEFDLPRQRAAYNRLIRSIPEHVIDEPTAQQAETLAKQASADTLRERIAFAQDVLSGKHGSIDDQARIYYTQSLQRDQAALRGLESPPRSTSTYGVFGALPPEAEAVQRPRLAPEDRYVSPQERRSAFLGAANREALNAAGGAVAGNIMGGTGPGSEDQNPEDIARNTILGAAGAVALRHGGRLGINVARRVGAEAEGGALATLGVGPQRPANQSPAAAANPNVRRVGQMMAGNYQIKTPPDPRTAMQRIGAAFSTAWTDNRAGLYQLQDAVSNAIGRPLQAGEMVAELSRLNPASVASQRLSENLRPALQAVGEDQDWLAQYLVHSHNLDVARELGQRTYDAAIQAGKSPIVASREAIRAANARQFSGDLNLAETQQALADIKASVTGFPDGQQRWQAIEDAAQAVWDHNKQTLDRKLQTGLIDQNLYNELTTRYPRYVRTDIADYFERGAGGPAPAGRLMGASDAGIQKLDPHGTGKDRVNPLLSTIDQTYTAESAIQRNVAGQAFEELLRQDPSWQAVFREVTPQQGVNVGNPATTVPGSYKLRGGEQFLTVWDQGTPRTFVIPEAFAPLVQPQGGRILGDNALANTWRAAMGIYKSLITSKNPAFSLLVSPIRDAGDYALKESVASAEHGGVRGAGEALAALPGVVRDYVKAVPDAFAGILQGQYKGDLADLMRTGAGQGSRPGHTDADLRQALHELSSSGGIQVRNLDDLKSLIGNVVTLGAEPIGNRLEQVPRLAAARRAAARGASSTEQAMAFRDATVDFQRGGDWAKAINSVVPFFNVAIQGGAQVARTARQNPAAFVAATAATIGSMTAASEAWNHADDQRARDYADVPDYLKKTGVVFMLPGVEGSDQRGDRRPNFVWIPTGNYAAFVASARDAINKTGGGEGGADLSTLNGWGSLAADVAGTFSPLRGDSAGAVLTSITPPGLSTGLELAANKDLYRGATIATDRADEQASALSQGSASAFNAVSGMETRPSQWEYLYRDLGGFGAGAALEGSNMAVRALGMRPDVQEDRPIQNAPVVGGIAGRVVRDSVGQGLQVAQDERNRVPDSIRSTLQEVGLRREQVLPVSSTLQNVPLTRAEQQDWQERTNAYVEDAVDKATRSAAYRRPNADRQKIIQQAISDAKDRAGTEVLRTIPPPDRRQRIRDAQQRKAS